MKVNSVRNLIPIRDGQGVEITLHLVRYGSSTSGAVVPTVWSEQVPEVAQGNYLWTWTHIEYSDGKSTDAYSVSRMGIDGRGVKLSRVDYSMQESPLDPEKIDDWGRYPSTLREGFWLYTRTLMVYSDDESTTSYSVSQIGVGSYYAGCVEYYSASKSDSEPVSPPPAAGTYANGELIRINDDWKQTRPVLDSVTPYLWNFEISADSRGNRYVTRAICIGNFARGIAKVVETYCISRFSKPDVIGKKYPSDCLRWSDEQIDAAPTDERPYQWNRTETTYNDGTVEYRYHVSAVRGTRGRDAHSPIVGDNGNWWFWDDETSGYKDSGESAAGDDGHSPYIGSNGHWWQWNPDKDEFEDTGRDAQGAGGSTPTIGANGNWYIDEVDTGVHAAGAQGDTPYIGQNGNWWIGNTDTGVAAQGENGNTPTIGDNGHWFINGEDTGRQAIGDDGHSPYVNISTGTWWEYNADTHEYEDTGIKAKAEDGDTPYIKDGYWWIGDVCTWVVAKGTNGNSPYIGEDGCWWVGTTNTHVKAQGDNGYTPSIGPDGCWWINGVSTGDPARGDEGHSPYIDEKTGTWWYWDHTQKRYVDSGIKPKGDNGADGAQGNLFGYGSEVVIGTDGYSSVTHTRTGFAALIEGATSGTTYVSIYYGQGNMKMFPPGVYSISGKVRFTNRSGLPERFNVRCTFLHGDVMDGSIYLMKRDGSSAAHDVCAGVEYVLKLKFNLTSEYFPYFAIEELGGGSDVWFVMEMSDVKIEHGETLTGVSTPFYGLGDDKRPVSQNLLLDTQRLSNRARWASLDGTVTANALCGCSSIRRVNSGGTLVDMLKQSFPSGSLKANTWYTLSYYAKASGDVTSHLYPNVCGFSTANCVHKVSQMTVDRPWTEDGEWWVSGAKGVNSGSSVMMVELINESSEDVTETINVMGSSEANYDYFYVSEEYLATYAAVKSSTTCIDKRCGNMPASDVLIEVAANSSRVLFIGYCKDASGNVNDDQYRVRLGKFIDDIIVHDGVAKESSPNCTHTISESTEWVLHTVTVHTSPRLRGDVNVLWRLNPGASLEVAMMKLEEGDAATPWCAAEDDRRGENGSSFNIMSWTDCMASGTWRFYSKNELTQELSVADIVIYNMYYYVCVKGYTATSSSPTPNVDEEHWRLFQNFSNVATDILISNAISTKIIEAVKARVDELVVKRLMTAELGPRIIAEGSKMSVYGRFATPNMVFGVDDEGNSIMSYYDCAGNKLYDLGPDGITETVQTSTAGFSYGEVNMAALASSTSTKNDINGAMGKGFNFASGNVWKKYYKLIVNWVSEAGVKKYFNYKSRKYDLLEKPSYDGKIYELKVTDPEGGYITDGWYRMTRGHLAIMDKVDTELLPGKFYIECAYYESGSVYKTVHNYLVNSNEIGVGGEYNTHPLLDE